MNETNFDKACRKHTIIVVLGITVLALLMLVSIAGAAQSSDAWIKKGIALEILNKHEEAIKACDKAIEINPLNWNAWYAKGIALEKLGKSNEATKAYKKAVELNPKLLKYGQ
jgi:Flp pilus assembly protein TadD